MRSFDEPFGASLVTLSLLAAAASTASAVSAQTLHYRASLAVTDSTLWLFAVEAPVRERGLTTVVWRSESGDAHRRVYRLSSNGDTPEWTVHFPERATDYTVRRRGDTLTVLGSFEGSAIDGTLEIDDDPVFGNVALGIAAALRSDAEKTDFWAFRPAEADVIHMDAKREAIDTLDVEGVSTPAVRVRLAPKGWRGLFFSRRFWFRASDGVLLRTDVDEGRMTTLAGES